MSESEDQKYYRGYGYSKAIVFPSEDPDAFEALHRLLLKEYAPGTYAGYEDVLSLANNFWRKRQIGHIRQRELEDLKFEADLRTKSWFAEAKVLDKICKEVESGSLGSFSEKDLPAKVGVHWARYLNKYFPRKLYANDDDWLWALREAIGEKMLYIESLEVEMRNFENKFADPVRMTQLLELEEQIDAANEKIVKRLERSKAKNMPVRGVGTTESWQSLPNIPARPKFTPQRPKTQAR
jgi:hypothetical protein